jgi:hypothetical protein
MRRGDRAQAVHVRIHANTTIEEKAMGHLSAISTAQIEEGCDAIDRAAIVADAVSSIAVRGREGVPSVGILCTYATTTVTETALRIAAAMGFRAHRVALASPLGRSIVDPHQGDEMIEGFQAELDGPGATFHVIEADQRDDAHLRMARLVAAISARRPADQRTSILVATRGDYEQLAFAIGRALRIDPDDIVARVF